MQEMRNQFIYYEPDYHSTTEAQLQLLGWMQYKNEICQWEEGLGELK